MCGPITSRFHTTDLAAESAFADYLIATARCDPVKFIDVSRCVLFDTPFVGSLLSNHLEDSVRRHQKSTNQNLNHNVMLPLICAAEKASHVIISLYSLSEGYSISLRHKDGKWVESVRIPYSQSDIIFSIDQGLFPAELSDLLHSVVPPVIRNGHLVAEVRDYRPPVMISDLPYERSFHLLSSTCLISKQEVGNNGTQSSESNALLSTENRLIDAICCDPRPAVFLVRSAYARNAKQIFSPKLTGILKKRFKTMLRSQNLPILASSRSMFSVFKPQVSIPERKMPVFKSEVATSEQQPNILAGIIEQCSVLSPIDDVFYPRTQPGLLINPISSFMEILVDEIVLKQSYYPFGTVSKQPAGITERFIRIRINFSQRTGIYSVHHDYAVSLSKALSMAEEYPNAVNPILGTQGDVFLYLRQFVSLLVAESGGKVEIVHYKQINRQHSLALDRRGLRAFDPGATSSGFSTGNIRTISNSDQQVSRQVKDEETSISPEEELETAFESEKQPKNSTDDQPMSIDRQNAPQTPSSQTYAGFIENTGLTPNLIGDTDNE